MLNAHSTIAEINAELEAGTATLADARKILGERAKHDSAPGRRADAWLKAHKVSRKPVAAKPPVRASKPAKPTNYRTLYANAWVKHLGIAKNEAGWRKAFFDAYKSDEARAYEAKQLAKVNA